MTSFFCFKLYSGQSPVGSLWILEIKHDGYRYRFTSAANRVRLYTITDVDWTDRYPWIGDGAKAIKLETAILEAER